VVGSSCTPTLLIKAGVNQEFVDSYGLVINLMWGGIKWSNQECIEGTAQLASECWGKGSATW
jgi:hypothetical protein